MGTEDKNAGTEERERESKRDFLKTAGAGLGMAGLAAVLRGTGICPERQEREIHSRHHARGG